MAELFTNVVHASLYGSVVIAAVCLLRLALKRAPKSMICLLWLLAGLRLMMPFEIESHLSLQPRMEPLALEQPVTIKVPDVLVPDDAPLPEADAAIPEVDAAIPEVDAPIQENVTLPTEQTHFVYAVENGKIRSLNTGDILACIWLVGMAAMMAASLVSYWKLKRTVREAWRTGDGCWECDRIDTAFVLGFLRPRVYLPVGLGEREREFILAHEHTHIARRDHLWKLAGYGILTVHWFNPLVWLAYGLLCRDMELACDEHVVKHMDLEQRKAYSGALLSCAAKHGRFAACPVAFGETDVKGRIQNVLHYKKPGFWITVIAVAAALFVAVCLVTSPSGENGEDGISSTQTSTETTASVSAKPEELSVTYKNHEFQYQGRDLEWEEDVVYLAKTLLEKHLKLRDGYEQTYNSKLEEYIFINRNVYYDGETRRRFLGEIETLLKRIPELEDYEIRCEMMRIVAGIEDGSTKVNVWSGDMFPLEVMEMEDQGQLGLYAVRVPSGYEEVLYGRLVSVNGVPIDDILDKLCSYSSNDNEYREKTNLYGRGFESLLVQADLLRAIGVLEADADTAEFVFKTGDGRTLGAELSAVSSEQANMSGAWVDFATRGITLHQNSGMNYWYTLLEEENTLYVRIAVCYEVEAYPFPVFCQEIIEELKAGEGMKLVIDLRQNTGGNYPMEGYRDFEADLLALDLENIAILIDNKTAGAADTIAWKLLGCLESPVFVGTPTGKKPGAFGNNLYEYLPNSQMKVTISKQYYADNEASGLDALTPDILVYQNLDDHKQGVDTVLETALAIGFDGAAMDLDISQQIAELEEELQQIQEEVTANQTYVCMEHGCTDSSHDHSARDCTTPGCTDVSHGHSHHDH